MSTSTTPLLSLGAARALAYDWHGGQRSGLYSFASTGEPYTRDLERAIDEVSYDRAHLRGGPAHSEHRALGNLLAFLGHMLAQRADRDSDD